MTLLHCGFVLSDVVYGGGELPVERAADVEGGEEEEDGDGQAERNPSCRWRHCWWGRARISLILGIFWGLGFGREWKSRAPKSEDEDVGCMAWNKQNYGPLDWLAVSLGMWNGL